MAKVSTVVQVGKKVPDFRLESTAGPWRLKDAAGRALVVYFYPKDATSGCTKEGEAFRDLHAQFRKAGAEVVGVSPDSIASHEKFKAKHGFPFELLSDPEQAA
ncbi:MAG: peroxiredoxin, partial [Pseudomonadota bacterium]